MSCSQNFYVIMLKRTLFCTTLLQKRPANFGNTTLLLHWRCADGFRFAHVCVLCMFVYANAYLYVYVYLYLYVFECTCMCVGHAVCVF